MTVQVVAVTGEDRMLPLPDLDVEVTGRTPARPDLSLAGQPKSHAVLDTGRHLDGDGAACPHPALAGTVGAGMTDLRPDAAALRTGARGDQLAEERPLHRLHLAAAAARGAGLGMGAGSGAGALADAADNRCVEGELARRAERRLVQVEVDPDQRVGTRADPRARPASAHPGAAEEGVHDVGE